MFVIFIVAVLTSTVAVVLVALLDAWWVLGFGFADARDRDSHRRADDRAGDGWPRPLHRGSRRTAAHESLAAKLAGEVPRSRSPDRVNPRLARDRARTAHAPTRCAPRPGVASADDGYRPG